jgi:hypothetical protein
MMGQWRRLFSVRLDGAMPLLGAFCITLLNNAPK